MNEEQEGFKVSDKRKFDAEGNLRQPEATEAAPEAKPEPQGKESQTEQAEPIEGMGEAQEEPEAVGEEKVEITFSAFILSLGTQAMVGLGLIPDPITNEKKTNLSLARQMIDIIAMLQDKSSGNLDDSENTLIENLLHDLRLKYVELAQEKS